MTRRSVSASKKTAKTAWIPPRPPTFIPCRAKSGRPCEMICVDMLKLSCKQNQLGFEAKTIN